MIDFAPTQLLFPAILSKKATAAFDGGAITSDGCVLLLVQAERRMRIADRLAALILDPHNPGRLEHSLSQILRVRRLAIAAGYEDGDDPLAGRRMEHSL